MIWLTWRQLRTQAVVLFAAVAGFAAVLAVTGPRLAHRRAVQGDAFLARTHGLDTALYLLGVVAVLLTPFVIGMFWGAPLVTRELDTGTHRLVWTQSVTRTRWLLTKLGLTGLAAVAATGLLSLAVTWWSGPIDAAIARAGGAGTAPPPGLLVFPRLSPEVFNARGVAPLGYAAFAFVLGVAAGMLVRRTLPAMAIAAVALAATQIAVSVGVRPHLITPESRTVVITSAGVVRIGMGGNLTVALDRPGAWSVGQRTVDASGRAVRPPSWLSDCPPPGVGSASDRCFARLAGQGYRQRVSYQPAGRFWAFQRDEMVLYLALAGLLAAFCVWWIRRRIT